MITTRGTWKIITASYKNQGINSLNIYNLNPGLINPVYGCVHGELITNHFEGHPMTNILWPRSLFFSCKDLLGWQNPNWEWRHSIIRMGLRSSLILVPARPISDFRLDTLFWTWADPSGWTRVHDTFRHPSDFVQPWWLFWAQNAAPVTSLRTSSHGLGDWSCDY